VVLVAEDGRRLAADRVVVLTGFRPDLSFLSELRLELDPTLQAPVRIAAEVDPNVHSCGSVAATGAADLAHPEPGFFIVGAKSYGRAPTFALTGYEQVRSVVADVAGDHEAARRVELVLPDTGVCGGAGLFDASGASRAAPAAHRRLSPSRSSRPRPPSPDTRTRNAMTDSTKPAVLFVCVHNAGRSQMAAGYLRALAGDRIDVFSAGSEPGNAVNPAAVAVMAEEGIDLSSATPQILTTDAVRQADVVITMGCGDACPIFPESATRTGS
jgi:hypothetical protein